MNIPVPSGLLVTMGNLSRWHFYWFKTRVAGTSIDSGDPDFNMGEQMCGDLISQTSVIGVVTKAKWYYDPVTNETTLIVDNI